MDFMDVFFTMAIQFFYIYYSDLLKLMWSTM